jgi:hypothetical protein
MCPAGPSILTKRDFSDTFQAGELTQLDQIVIRFKQVN